MTTKPPVKAAAKTPAWGRRLPILLIALVALTGAVLLRDHLSFEALERNREALLAWRDANYLLTVLVWLLAYVAIVGFSLPGATVATLTGGFLFGLIPGFLFSVLAATTGAIGIFLAARAGFGARFAEDLQARGGTVARLQAGLADNEWSVLLMLRLVPAVPFFLANLLPAFLGVRLLPFAITTFFGIMPGTLVISSIGSGLGEIFARGEAPDFGVIFAPQVLLPILGLAALSGLPMLLKMLRKKRTLP